MGRHIKMHASISAIMSFLLIHVFREHREHLFLMLHKHKICRA